MHFPSLLQHYVCKSVVCTGHCREKLRFGLLPCFNKYIYLGQTGVMAGFQSLYEVLHAQ